MIYTDNRQEKLNVDEEFINSLVMLYIIQIKNKCYNSKKKLQSHFIFTFFIFLYFYLSF